MDKCLKNDCPCHEAKAKNGCKTFMDVNICGESAYITHVDDVVVAK